MASERSASSDNSSASANPETQNVAQQPHEERSAARKTYSCRYCDKTFPTSMALGGHQNGHRNERVVAKQRERGPSFSQQYSSSSYAGYQPYIGSALTQSFSTWQRSESVTSKPSYTWLFREFRSSSSTPSYNWRGKPQEFTESLTMPKVPSLQSKASHPSTGQNSNKFFGVDNFFHSAPQTSDCVTTASNSNMFFGVHDFSTPRITTSDGAGTSTAPTVDNVDSEIDLNLKLGH